MPTNSYTLSLHDALPISSNAATARVYAIGSSPLHAIAAPPLPCEPFVALTGPPFDLKRYTLRSNGTIQIRRYCIGVPSSISRTTSRARFSAAGVTKTCVFPILVFSTQPIPTLDKHSCHLPILTRPDDDRAFLRIEIFYEIFGHFAVAFRFRFVFTGIVISHTLDNGLSKAKWIEP